MKRLRKLIDTLRIVTMLFLARTFGQYEHSGWNTEFEFVRYRLRGRSWVIPTTACDEEPQP